MTSSQNCSTCSAKGQGPFHIDPKKCVNKNLRRFFNDKNNWAKTSQPQLTCLHQDASPAFPTVRAISSSSSSPSSCRHGKPKHGMAVKSNSWQNLGMYEMELCGTHVYYVKKMYMTVCQNVLLVLIMPSLEAWHLLDFPHPRPKGLPKRGSVNVQREQFCQFAWKNCHVTLEAVANLGFKNCPCFHVSILL